MKKPVKKSAVGSARFKKRTNGDLKQDDLKHDVNDVIEIAKEMALCGVGDDESLEYAEKEQVRLDVLKAVLFELIDRHRMR